MEVFGSISMPESFKALSEWFELVATLYASWHSVGLVSVSDDRAERAE